MRGGAFDYDLFRGGLGGSAPNDWFLRSSFDVRRRREPRIRATRSRNAGRSAAGEHCRAGTCLIIGSEIATYGVVRPIARELGQTTLGTLHERVGDTLTRGGQRQRR